MRNLIAVIALGIVFTSCTNERTAYVDTTELIQEFSEMKEVETEFTTRSEKLRKELDSAASAFQSEVMAFNNESSSMSQKQLEEKGQELQQKQQQLQLNQQRKSNELRAESEKVIDSLVTKVKDFVADYGERNNYTYIFGSNESANIMYAKEGLDITQEVLKELNASVE